MLTVVKDRASSGNLIIHYPLRRDHHLVLLSAQKSVEWHTAKLNSLVLAGLINPFWGGVAADNLARFMDGKGGVKYIDSEWLRSFDKVKTIENSLMKDINSRIEQIAPTLADGESRTVSYSVSPQIVFEDAFYFTELFWATGSSTIKVSVTLDLTKRWRYCTGTC